MGALSQHSSATSSLAANAALLQRNFLLWDVFILPLSLQKQFVVSTPFFCRPLNGVFKALLSTRFYAVNIVSIKIQCASLLTTEVISSRKRYPNGSYVKHLSTFPITNHFSFLNWGNWQTFSFQSLQLRGNETFFLKQKQFDDRHYFFTKLLFDVSDYTVMNHGPS